MGSLANALDAALAAARDAADLLRAEFHRPGGPRGEDGHCPADGEAEDLIRQRLVASFPGWGFVGEERPELDRLPGADGYAWVIDPNDGTSDFQRGHRGAAVSIALLREGEPVLGVVLAPTAPHGGEDLFAWAEGEGPARRNGVPLHSLPDAGLEPGDVVLVSGDAPRAIEGWLDALAPARPRAQASIAYRLALAAAGEARAAISIHRPRVLDVAGGHALLRGVGGALVDASRAELRYPRDGHARVDACFGGPRRAAVALAGRGFPTRAPGAGGEGPGLVRPVPGGGIADRGRLARAQGALLGQLAGDALGSLVEFADAATIRRNHPRGVRELVDGGTWDTLAGQPTDDSELALALARALVEGEGFDAGRVARAYAGWHQTGPFDEGSTTRAALSAAARAVERGLPDPEVAAAARGAARRESLANGALMRISPAGIAAGDPARAAAWAREDAALTHPNPICAAASAVFAAALSRAVETGEGPREIADFALALAAGEGMPPEVRDALAAAREGPPDTLLHQGLVTVALQNAFYELGHAASLEEALVATVGRGGDTDTNAAIAGALLGAVHGVRAVPQRWVRAVLSCFPVAGAPGVKHPRPPSCWAVDALVLAERLAAGTKGPRRDVPPGC